MNRPIFMVMKSERLKKDNDPGENMGENYRFYGGGYGYRQSLVSFNSILYYPKKKYLVCCHTEGVKILDSKTLKVVNSYKMNAGICVQCIKWEKNVFVVLLNRERKGSCVMFVDNFQFQFHDKVEIKLSPRAGTRILKLKESESNNDSSKFVVARQTTPQLVVYSRQNEKVNVISEITCTAVNENIFLLNSKLSETRFFCTGNKERNKPVCLINYETEKVEKKFLLMSYDLSCMESYLHFKPASGELTEILIAAGREIIFIDTISGERIKTVRVRSGHVKSLLCFRLNLWNTERIYGIS